MIRRKSRIDEIISRAINEAVDFNQLDQLNKEIGQMANNLGDVYQGNVSEQAFEFVNTLHDFCWGLTNAIQRNINKKDMTLNEYFNPSNYGINGVNWINDLWYAGKRGYKWGKDKFDFRKGYKQNGVNQQNGVNITLKKTDEYNKPFKQLMEFDFPKIEREYKTYQKELAVDSLADTLINKIKSIYTLRLWG